jgi:hypothetical protein
MTSANSQASLIRYSNKPTANSQQPAD